MQARPAKEKKDHMLSFRHFDEKNFKQLNKMSANYNLAIM